MSSEARAIRPFESMLETERLLRQFAVLRVDDDADQSVAAGGTLVVTPDAYLTRGIAVCLGTDVAQHSQIAQSVDQERRAIFGDSHADLDLIVVVSTPRLRFADVVVRIPLDEAGHPLPDVLRLDRADERPRALRTPRGGCEITLAIVLASERPKRPLEPWRAGTWLARVRFKLRTTQHETGFQPIPLTSTAREQFRLDEGTTHFARSRGGAGPASRAVRIDDVMEFFVDEDVLAIISADPYQPVAKLMQTRFVIDAVRHFHALVRKDDQLEVWRRGDRKGTLLHQLLCIAARDERAPDDLIDRLLDELIEQPERAIARLEAAWDLQRLTAEALKVKP
jgi:hypothetical protein